MPVAKVVTPWLRQKNRLRTAASVSMDKSRRRPAPWLIAALKKRAQEKVEQEEVEQEEVEECGT